jgi:hypothetical protein
MVARRTGTLFADVGEATDAFEGVRPMGDTKKRSKGPAQKSKAKKAKAKKNEAKKATAKKQQETKRAASPQPGWAPLGIGSHHTLVEDQATFGDFRFERTDVGNYSITFLDVGCREQEWPPPIIFTNVSGDRVVSIEGWDCKADDFIVYVTSAEGGEMTDSDFDWIVYR